MPKRFLFTEAHINKSARRPQSQEVSIPDKLMVPSKIAEDIRSEQKAIRLLMNQYYNMLLSGDPNAFELCANIQNQITLRITHFPELKEIFLSILNQFERLKTPEAQAATAHIKTFALANGYLSLAIDEKKIENPNYLGVRVKLNATIKKDTLPTSTPLNSPVEKKGMFHAPINCTTTALSASSSSKTDSANINHQARIARPRGGRKRS